MPTDWCSYGPFTVFDLETTGMSPVNDRIVEIAAVRIELDGTRTRYHSLINPGRGIPRRVTAVHHITDAMVADAPDFNTAAVEFMALAQKSTLVAHNAFFDLGFLQESLARCGRQLWNGKTIDTVRLLRRTHPGLPSYSLRYLRGRFGLETAPGMRAHRAGSDVDWTVEVLRIALTSALTGGCRA